MTPEEIAEERRRAGIKPTRPHPLTWAYLAIIAGVAIIMIAAGLSSR